MATDTGIASGAIANCTDGADSVPIVKWEAQARSLSGVSSVDYKHSAKNLLVLDFANRTVVTSATYANTTPRDFSKPYIYVGISGNNYFRNDYINSYSYTDTSITVNTKTKGYGIGITLSVDPNTQYRLSYANSASSYLAVGFYDKDGAYINWQPCDTSAKHTFTTPSNCVNLMVVFRPNVVDTNYTYANIQMEFGSTTTSYEPPVPVDVKTATLGRTVYGAKLNLTSGTGTENMVRVKISDLTWTYYTGGTNPIFYTQNVSNLKMYSRGELPNIRIQGFNDPVFAQRRSYQSKNMADLDCSVFEDTSTITFRCTAYTSRDDMLAAIGDNYIIYETTQTTDFTFDPISKPETYLGMNNFWIDCGDSSVEYYKSGYGFTSVTLNLGTGKNQVPDNVTWTMGTRDDSGNHVASNTSHYSSPIPVVPNSNYAFQGMYPDGVNTAWRIYRLDANKNWVSRSSAVTANKYVAGSGANIYYIQLECSSTIGATDIQVEKNGRCSDFEPYSATSVTAKLHKLVYLANIDAIRGTGLVTWHKVVYTGADDEAWGQSISSGVYRYYIKNNDVKQPTSDRGVVYSSIGTYGSGNAVGTIFSSAYNQDTRIFYIPPQTCTTTAEFKTWLQSNNLDVTYEKATPESFTFPPVSFDTIEGEQFLFASEGNSALTYRKAVDS